MKTFYDLLLVSRDAPADEIKRAFRREIARYHPDKVQHLGTEFQEIASSRAAELTEAYRILMDPGDREKYDASLDAPARQTPGPPPPPPAAAAATASRAEPTPPSPPRADTPRAATNLFVKKAVLRLLAEAVAEVMPAATTVPARGFDAVYALKGKRSLFGKVTPDVRILARIVSHVDPVAVEEAWALARAAAGGETACILLLGAGLAPAKELSAAVGEQRRRTRATNLVMVPVDVRDWEALTPPDTPAPVRAVLQRLKQGKG